MLRIRFAWIAVLSAILVSTILIVGLLYSKISKPTSAENQKSYVDKAYHFSLTYPASTCMSFDSHGNCLRRIPVQLTKVQDGIVIKPTQTTVGNEIVTSTDISNKNFNALDQINVIAGTVKNEAGLTDFIEDKLNVNRRCVMESIYPTNIPGIKQFTLSIKGRNPLTDYPLDAVSTDCPVLRTNYRALYDEKKHIAYIVSQGFGSAGDPFKNLKINGTPFNDLGIENNPGTNHPRLTFHRRLNEDADSKLDVDDPVISGFHDKTAEDRLNFTLQEMETDINNWRRNPFYDEKNIYQRRCLPLIVNDTQIRFTCTAQSWHGKNTDGAETRIYTLNSVTGEWIDDLSLPDPHVLTEKDFSGSGLSIRRPSSAQDTFSVVIHPSLLPYTFRVTSDEVYRQGQIEVFKEGDASNTPIQVISLDPNMWLYDMVPSFFNVQDVNFDGFVDIGVPHEGGAKWVSYTYWIFDQKTGRFLTAPASKDLAKIGFSLISFDKEKRQITTTNTPGVGSARSLYQFQQDRIYKLKDEKLENIVQRNVKGSTDQSTLYCAMTTTNYAKGSVYITRKVFPRECENSMHTIPFNYPKERAD